MDQVGAVTPRGRGLVVLGIALAIGAALGLAWCARSQRPADAPGIAVLPFDDRSPDPADAYLAPGLQDELTRLLTRVGTLRVLSRDSTARYAGTGAGSDTAQIARALGVDYLLAGRVRRAGAVLHVEATLLDAAGAHVMESTFERQPADLFAIGSETARAVAETVQGRRLTAAERSAVLDPPTPEPAAYDAYLRARAFTERSARDEADIRAAIAAYRTVVRLDPRFAAAWSQLARRESSLYSLGYERTEERRAAALRAVESAQRLAPDALDTRAARAYYLFVVQEDLEAAERAVLELERRFPASPDVATGLSQITRELGELGRSAEYSRRAVQLDPLNPWRRYQLCQDYLASREMVLAMHTCDAARDLLPGDTGILALKASLHQARGELAPAHALLGGLAPGPGDWRTLRVMARQLELERHPGSAADLLAKHLAAAGAFGTRTGVVRRWLADAQRLAGAADAARASYATARAELEDELARQPSNPLFAGELAIVHARLGDDAAARGLAQRCEQLARASRRTGYIGDCGLARLQVALAANATDELPRLLDAALRQRGALPPLTVSQLRLDPDFDAHRDLVRTLTPD